MPSPGLVNIAIDNYGPITPSTGEEDVAPAVTGPTSESLPDFTGYWVAAVGDAPPTKDALKAGLCMEQTSANYVTTNNTKGE